MIAFRRGRKILEIKFGPNVVNNHLIIRILLSHFLNGFEGRVYSEKVPGLSDDPETELISGTIASSSDGILITI